MLQYILFILLALAAGRSIIRFGKFRRLSDVLLAFFWLSLGAALLLDSAAMILIAVAFLFAGTITKSSDLVAAKSTKATPAQDEPEPLLQSHPSPSSLIGQPEDLSKRESNQEAPHPRFDSPEEPDKAEPLIPRIPEIAEDCVTYGKIMNRVLDYSPASLNELDDLISTEWGEQPPPVPDVTILQVGSYVGEILRLNLGGNWEETDDRGVHLANVGKTGYKVFPFTKARKRILEGEGDSLAFFYRALRHSIEKDSSADEKN